MAKCTKCGKEIKNTYMLNGKAYGYNCYKQELAMVLAEKEKLANEKYKIDAAVTVEILKNRNKLNDFIKSIINFYEEKGFLSYKQMECIKLTDQEKFEKWLTIYEVSTDSYRKEEIEDRIYNMLYDKIYELNVNIYDERLIALLRANKKIQRRVQKGKVVSVLKYRNNNKLITTIDFVNLKILKEELKEDEIDFIEGIEIC